MREQVDLRGRDAAQPAWAPRPPRKPPMILRYAYLRQHPHVFKVMTGLTVPLFEDLCWDVRPLLAEAVYAARTRPWRQRPAGAGHPYALESRGQILLPVICRGHYPPPWALGCFFGARSSAVLL